MMPGTQNILMSVQVAWFLSSILVRLSQSATIDPHFKSWSENLTSGISPVTGVPLPRSDTVGPVLDTASISETEGGPLSGNGNKSRKTLSLDRSKSQLYGPESDFSAEADLIRELISANGIRPRNSLELPRLQTQLGESSCLQSLMRKASSLENFASVGNLASISKAQSVTTSPTKNAQLSSFAPGALKPKETKGTESLTPSEQQPEISTGSGSTKQRYDKSDLSYYTDPQQIMLDNHTRKTDHEAHGRPFESRAPILTEATEESHLIPVPQKPSHLEVDKEEPDKAFQFLTSVPSRRSPGSIDGFDSDDEDELQDLQEYLSYPSVIEILKDPKLEIESQPSIDNSHVVGEPFIKIKDLNIPTTIAEPSSPSPKKQGISSDSQSNLRIANHKTLGWTSNSYFARLMRKFFFQEKGVPQVQSHSELHTTPDLPGFAVEESPPSYEFSAPKPFSKLTEQLEIERARHPEVRKILKTEDEVLETTPVDEKKTALWKPPRKVLAPESLMPSDSTKSNKESNEALKEESNEARILQKIPIPQEPSPPIKQPSSEAPRKKKKKDSFIIRVLLALISFHRNAKKRLSEVYHSIRGALSQRKDTDQLDMPRDALPKFDLLDKNTPRPRKNLSAGPS